MTTEALTNSAPMTWPEASEDWRKVVDQYRAAMAEVAEVMRNAREKPQ